MKQISDKAMDDDPESHDPEPDAADAKAPGRELAGRIAPIWHTVILVMLLLAVSLANTRIRPHAPHADVGDVGSRIGSRIAGQHGSRWLSYSLTLAWEWFLLLFVVWGLRLRRTPLRQLLGVRRPGAMEWWTDIAIASGFWFASAMTLAACSLLLRLAHLDPDTIRTALLRLAPASAAELALWIALSISAGICEELLFRGYLQQQFSALARSVWIGAAFSAILFGLAHGYQGVSGVLLITLYGAFFSILAHRRGSLRPGIFAHAWQDASSGIMLFLLVHVLHRVPH